jgi:hypothetical protein
VRPSLTFPSECFGRTSVKGSVANIYEVVMDADHNFYPVAKIGDQTWMTQNLMTSKTADGTALSQDDYESNPSDPQQYPNAGYLYRTYVPGLTQSICPNGWTVPSIADYQTLNSVDPTYAAFNHIYCMYYDGSAWLGHNQYYITSNLYQSEEYYCVNIEHVTPGYFANFSYGKIPLRCIKANN